MALFPLIQPDDARFGLLMAVAYIAAMFITFCLSAGLIDEGDESEAPVEEALTLTIDRLGHHGVNVSDNVHVSLLGDSGRDQQADGGQQRQPFAALHQRRLRSSAD